MQAQGPTTVVKLHDLHIQAAAVISVESYIPAPTFFASECNLRLDSFLALTLDFTLDSSKGTPLLASGLVSTKNLSFFASSKIPEKERVVDTTQDRTSAH